MEVRAMEYRPVMPTGVIPTGLQDYHATIPDLSPPRSQGSSTGGASSIGDYAPRMYTPPTPPTPHDDDKVKAYFLCFKVTQSQPCRRISPLFFFFFSFFSFFFFFFLPCYNVRARERGVTCQGISNFEIIRSFWLRNFVGISVNRGVCVKLVIN